MYIVSKILNRHKEAIFFRISKKKIDLFTFKNKIKNKRNYKETNYRQTSKIHILQSLQQL